MPSKLSDSMTKIKDSWSGLEFKVKRRILFWGMLSLIALASTVLLLNRTDYVVLYSKLDVKEVAEIDKLLTDLGVKSKNSSGTILVEKGREEDVRMKLAVQGYPKTGLNYDLYLNNINFSTSTRDKNIMLRYQLQDRLSNTIKLLQGITNAVVTISMDMQEDFQLGSQKNPVTANVLLELEPMYVPEKQHIRAIQKLMITSISGLKEENVAIIDSEANDLLPNTNNDPLSAITSSQFELKKSVEKELQNKIIYMFEPVFGSKNIKVSVNATFDFDKRKTQLTEYTPIINNEGIPFTIDELTEKFSDSSTNAASGSDSLNERVQKVVNYRVNELTRTIEEAQGVIKDISISILINDTTLDQDGLFNISQIVGASVDVDTANINVSNMDFTADKVEAQRLKDALDAAKQEVEEPFPISEQTMIIIAGMFFAFIFALILLRTIRKAMAKPKVDIEVPQVSSQELEELLTSEELAKVKEEERVNKEKLAEEQKIIEDITQIAKVNPKNAADLIAYWMEKKDEEDEEVVGEELS
ncbi:hypothetical protein IMX26_00440 [Clostridium sp. 'deep sea']|uniref:flagellar M-ring protein FliF C-terminal domain-containing protein n=1 Tax=Clostridium sp. 'deep sea' TaxID=2779445 RepID=UPI0018966256|nr:flagellar M-ring protein FliF C-terminal domain-containing protein [Clostridium sp. 'deep sea']QOR35344.1 hypothetical protein IMX26_00440 [Clostridium sp. 'deep sea']